MAERAHIAALRLRRFRSHEAFEGAFGPGPIAIFGPNGVGKTNILEAVSTLSPGRGLRGASAEEMAARPNPIGWSVAAEIRAGAVARAVSVAVDLREGGRKKVVIDGEAVGQAALGETLRMLWLTPAMDRLWIEGASERRRFLDRLALLFEPAHSRASAAYERALRERNKLLKDGVRDPAWFAAIETRLAESGAVVAAARSRAIERIAAAQTGGSFPEAALAIESADENAPAAPESAEALALRLAAARPREAAAGRTLVGPHREDLAAIYREKEMPARQCSTGEQKALLVSVVLAAARAASEAFGAPPVLLLDEVAAHFDAERRADLFAAVAALGAQAWMTAAGAEFFEELGDAAERLALNPG